MMPISPTTLGSTGFTLGPDAVIGSVSDPTSPAPSSRQGFGQLLGAQLQNLNAIQAGADTQAQLLATGQTNDVSSVVVASERASLALQLASQVRNKLIDAWHEIERTQV